MTLDKMHLIDLFGTVHPIVEYTFFSGIHEAVSQIDHIWGHKASLGKFFKNGNISRTFSDQNTVRFVIN